MGLRLILASVEDFELVSLLMVSSPGTRYTTFQILNYALVVVQVLINLVKILRVFGTWPGMTLNLAGIVRIHSSRVGLRCLHLLLLILGKQLGRGCKTLTVHRLVGWIVGWIGLLGYISSCTTYRILRLNHRKLLLQVVLAEQLKQEKLVCILAKHVLLLPWNILLLLECH